MSKKQLISLAVLVALVSLGGYLFSKQSAIVPQHTSAVEQIKPPTPTQTPLILPNNQKVVDASATTTAKEQVTPEMSDLLNLVKDCQIASVDFGDTYSHKFVSVKAITLKDGTSFANPSALSVSDVSILYQALLGVRYKCPIQMSAGRPHGDQ